MNQVRGHWGHSLEVTVRESQLSGVTVAHSAWVSQVRSQEVTVTWIPVTGGHHGSFSLGQLGKVSHLGSQSPGVTITRRSSWVTQQGQLHKFQRLSPVVTHSPAEVTRGHVRSQSAGVTHGVSQQRSHSPTEEPGVARSQSGGVTQGVNQHSPANIPRVAAHGRSLRGHVEHVTQVLELGLVREELAVPLEVLQHWRVVCVDGLEEGEGEGVRCRPVPLSVRHHHRPSAVRVPVKAIRVLNTVQLNVNNSLPVAKNSRFCNTCK